MLPHPRIAITGMGAVSAWGWGIGALKKGLRSGESAIRPFTRFDSERQRTQVAGEVPHEELTPSRSPGPWPRLSFADRFAIFATDEALTQAGLSRPLSDPRVGVYFASSTAGLFESELYLAAVAGGERPRLDLFASQQLNGPGDAVARHLGVTGPVLTISAACASATLALEAALRDLRSGIVDVAVAGGADSLSQITYSGFNSLRAVDERPCRPYREDRAGMSLGEGAGVVVLEVERSATARARLPVAEFSGAGSSCDASHMTAPQPDGEGAALAVLRALADADVTPADVAFVNVHGTGTPLNDAAEYSALARVFGENVSQVPLAATKGSVGHLLGSAGSLEAVISILALEQERLDPTPGGGPVDPSPRVALVLSPRPVEDGVAVSMNLAFGGANAALVFGRWSKD